MADIIHKNHQTREIRTYLPFVPPIDPARVLTIADMDISYALASTLVDWDETKQIQSQLAIRWVLIGDRNYRLQLRHGLKWSDGSLLTCQDVKKSFERCNQIHGDNLIGVLDQIETIQCVDDDTIDFRLKSPANEIVFLKKIAEPMYGIVKVRDDGSLDLSKSSGPFALESSSDQELVLKGNRFWFKYEEGMAQRVILRIPPKEGANLERALFHDSWANLTSVLTPIDQSTADQIKKSQLTMWDRHLDRILGFSFNGKRTVEAKYLELFRFLSQHLDRKVMARGLLNFTEANQVFPKGYRLFDRDLHCEKSPETLTLPEEFRKRSLRILYSPERVTNTFRENLSTALEAVTSKKPEFISMNMTNFREVIQQGNFDFYVGSVGMADPNYDGAIAYLVETNPVVIPSGQGKYDFRKRLAASRLIPNEKQRLHALQSLLTDTVCYGYFLPLFHYSTTVVAKFEIDLLQIPTTDESVSFSKVRFKTTKD